MKPDWSDDWIVPAWPAPDNVRAVFTTRLGGVSSVPYGSMNLGDHVGDVKAHVNANRAVLGRATGVRGVFLNQVHGNKVMVLDTAAADGQQADASVTTRHQLACTIMVADCLPVLLCTNDGSVVAAAHAGWRGLAGGGVVGAAGQVGVLESTHAAMKAAFAASFTPLAQQIRAPAAIKIIAWLGPCIGPTAFEVGPEVKAAFESAQSEAAECFIATGDGKYLADLSGLARLRLKALGITQVYGNDGSAPWCTAGNPSRFFSHRRDAGACGNGFGTTGRMAASIWRA